MTPKQAEQDSQPTADAATEPAPRRDYISTLDGLRGLAVLLVLWAHMPVGLMPGVVNAARFVIQPGYLGVDVFFVLSGFLITRILLFDKQRQRPLKYFIYRRFLRIFPIYYLTILVLLFVVPGLYLLWSALYVSNFVFAFDLSVNPLRHTWSLAVEEHFYLIWPFLVYGLSSRANHRLVVFVLIPLSLIAAVVTLQFSEAWFAGHGPDLLYRGTPYRALSLLLGSLIAYHETPLRARLGNLVWIAIAAGLAAMVVIPSGLVLPYKWLALTKMVGFAMASCTVVLFGIWAFDVNGKMRQLLSAASLCFVGRISYGLYLYHFPIFYFMGLRHEAGQQATAAEHDPVWSMLLLALGVTFAVAIASYYLIERPLLRFKDRLH